jgi:hypothetical protein
VLLIGFAAYARWPAAVRRLGEATAGGIAPVAILVIPLLVGAAYVWPWVQPSPELAKDIAPKQVWLSQGFFTVRTIVYLAVFGIGAELLIRWSRRRDDRPEPQVPHEVDRLDRERRFSSAMLPVVGIVLTFAAFDWAMSLQPGWWSTAFGLYIITGTMLAGLAMTVALAWRGVATGSMPLTPSHFHAMGRLLHAFVILWTYVAYFQAMLIVIANRPDEATFYVVRTRDGWRIVTAVLIALSFALPFPLLVPRRLKHRPAYVGAIATMLLVAHYLDAWWLVIPRIDDAIPSWTDLAALGGIGGLVVAACAWRMRGVPLLPVGDPYLAAGMAYETRT